MKRVIFLLFALMCCIAVVFNNYKLQALAFHPRDFAYYLQFGPKLLDAKLSPHVSLNPEGGNFLGFQGVEAAKSLHQAIHFEPVKYIEGILLFLFEYPLIIFIFFSVIFFAPILYLSFTFPITDKLDRCFVLLIALAYCLHPSVLFAVSYDARPSQIMFSLFVFSFLALTFGRPMGEILFFFNLMFLDREEALVFGLINIIYAVSLGYEYKKIRLLVLSWLFWASLIGIYFWWTGYANNGLAAMQIVALTSDKLNIMSIIPLLTMGIIFAGCTLLFWRRKSRMTEQLPLITFSLIFIPLSWQFYATPLSKSVAATLERLIYWPRIAIYVHCFLLLIILIWQRITNRSRKKQGLLALSICVVLFVALNLTTSKSALARFLDYANEKKKTEIIWRLREHTDKYNSSILSDKDVYQLFYDYNHIYVYERLPWYVAKEEKRYYPNNQAVLQKILENKIEFIVANKDSFKIIGSLLEKSKVANQVMYVDQNAQYIIYQIVRPDSIAIYEKQNADFDRQIRLATYQIERRTRSEGFHATFFLQRLAPIEVNYHVLVRLVGQQGEVWRDEGWPFGSPTSTWRAIDVWPDGHDITWPADTPFGYYRLELSFYNPKNFIFLPAYDTWTGKPLGDALVVDYLLVGEPPDIPADAPSYDLGESIHLLSSDLSANQQTLSAGERLRVRLFWQAETSVERDLTVFVHLVGPDGQLVSQQDQQPLGGFFPTSLWPSGQVIADDYELLLPADLPAGTYELRVGMYDLLTAQRLPVSQNGLVIGDYVSLASIPIEVAQ